MPVISKRAVGGEIVAYLREIGVQCARCIKPATHEVVNLFNAACGRFCKKHAKELLRSITADERRSDAAMDDLHKNRRDIQGNG